MTLFGMQKEKKILGNVLTFCYFCIRKINLIRMNKREHKEYLEAFKKYSKKISSSKKQAEEFLIRSGIHNRNGELSKAYITTK